MTATDTELDLGTLVGELPDDTVPCEQAEDDGCPNPATHRGAHIACGWGPLFCHKCIQMWAEEAKRYPYEDLEPTCKWCGVRVTSSDEMKAMPIRGTNP